MKRLLGYTGALLSLTLLLSACGSKPAQVPASKPEPQKVVAPDTAKTAPVEDLPVKLGLGSMDSLIYLPITYALNGKLFEAEHLKVESVQLKGGAQVTQSLVEGQADVAFGAMEHVLKYKQQGIDLVLVATLTEQPGAVLLVDSKYKATIKSLKDLKGQKIGVTSNGSGSDSIRLLLMEKGGLGPKDVEAIGVGFDVPKAFADGKVAAAITYAPYAEELIKSGKGYTLPEPAADLRNPEGVKALFGHDAMPMVTLMIYKQMISKNPEVVKRVAQAIVKAEKEIAAKSPEELAKVVPAPAGISDAAYLEALKQAKVWLSRDGLVRAETVDAVVGALKHIKALPDSTSIDAQSVINNTFVK
jgi:NitT/TauT family transport system substrate-binding protein